MSIRGGRIDGWPWQVAVLLDKSDKDDQLVDALKRAVEQARATAPLTLHPALTRTATCAETLRVRQYADVPDLAG